MRWWKPWLKRIRWTPIDRNGRHLFVYATDVRRDVPRCWCGTLMVQRAAYLMGGEGDWAAYECPRDRPWNFWRHSPWTTVRDVRAIVRWAQAQKASGQP